MGVPQSRLEYTIDGNPVDLSGRGDDGGNVRAIDQDRVEIEIPPVLVNTKPWRFVLGFCGLALLDIAMNAAAGAATAHVGAQLNGAASTPLVLRMGALAGATKGAITTFHQVVAMSSVNMVFQILLMLITSSFGVCALLVTQIGNTVLGETPREYLVAAVVAGVPLFFEMIRAIQPPQDDDGKPVYFRWVWGVFLTPMDALGGYVFARMAANQGVPISNYHAACSAGATFGAIAWLARAMTGCITLVQLQTYDGRTSNVFGVWEWVTPDPIVVTVEEYEAMQRGLAGALGTIFTMMPAVARGGLRFMTCCCGCCMGREMRDDLMEARADMAGMDEEGRLEEGYREVGIATAERMLPNVQPHKTGDPGRHMSA